MNNAQEKELIICGKHLCIKMAEVYAGSGINPLECQAIREWLKIIKEIEGQKPKNSRRAA